MLNIRFVTLAATFAVSLFPAATAAANPVGTQQQLTTFSPVSGGTTCGGPSLAYSASSAKTLAVWIENVAVSGSAPNGGIVRAAFMNGDAALSSAPVDISITLPSSEFYGCKPPSVTAGPAGTWLVLWPANSNLAIYGQVLDASGNRSGPNLTISSNTNYSYIQTVSAAWSPPDNRYLVSWKASVSNPFPGAANYQQVAGRFVDSSGAGLGNDFLVTDTADGIESSQDLAYGNGRWISVAATSGNQRSIGQVVTTAGPQGSIFDISTTGSPPANIAPSIAYNSATQQFAVAYWLRFLPQTHFLRLLDSNGAPIGSDTNLGPLGSRPRIASAGARGYLVVAHSPAGTIGRVSGLRILADGTPDGSAQEMSDAAPFEAWRPSVAYDASQGRFLVAFAGNIESATNYYARAWFVTTPPVALTVTREGTGSGTVASSPAGIDCGATCTFDFDSGASVTLTATPASGSSFTGWSGSGCSGTSTCTVTMSEARAVTAEFTVVPPGQFDLAVSKSGTGAGTVTSSPAGINCGADCSETLVDGTSVTLTATPAAGSSFAGWSGSGCSGTSTCTVVMSEARAVTAEFTAAPPPPPPPPPPKPSNVFPTPKVKAGASALASRVHVPGPGTLTQRVTRSSNLAAVLTVCKTSGKATKAGWVKLTCKLNAATRKALRQRSLRVSVKTTFTPTGGLPASKTQTVTLKSQRPPPYTG